MEALREQRASLRDESKRITEKIAGARRQSAFQASLPRRAAHVIWILFSLLSDPSAAILVFMGSAADDSILEVAENSFINADISDILAVCDVSNPRDVGAMRIAKRVYAEHELFMWCRALNLRGVTPTTRALLREAKKYVQALPASVQNAIVDGQLDSNARVWSQRWRARWGARLGKFASAECSTDELRSKVRA